jgi:hypothetical protein
MIHNRITSQQGVTNIGHKILFSLYLITPAKTREPKKLAFLQAEEAKAADAEQKFAIQQHIEECKDKIRELGGQL